MSDSAHEEQDRYNFSDSDFSPIRSNNRTMSLDNMFVDDDSDFDYDMDSDLDSDGDEDRGVSMNATPAIKENQPPTSYVPVILNRRRSGAGSELGRVMVTENSSLTGQNSGENLFEDGSGADVGLHQSLFSRRSYLSRTNAVVEELENNDMDLPLMGVAAFESAIRSLPKPKVSSDRRGNAGVNMKAHLMYFIRCLYDKQFRHKSLVKKCMADQLSALGLGEIGHSPILTLLGTYWYLVRQRAFELEWLVAEDHPLRLKEGASGWEKEEFVVAEWERNGNQGYEVMQAMTTEIWIAMTERLLECIKKIYGHIMNLNEQQSKQHIFKFQNSNRALEQAWDQEHPTLSKPKEAARSVSQVTFNLDFDRRGRRKSQTSTESLLPIVIESGDARSSSPNLNGQNGRQRLTSSIDKCLPNESNRISLPNQSTATSNVNKRRLTSEGTVDTTAPSTASPAKRNIIKIKVPRIASSTSPERLTIPAPSVSSPSLSTQVENDVPIELSTSREEPRRSTNNDRLDATTQSSRRLKFDAFKSVLDTALLSRTDVLDDRLVKALENANEDLDTFPSHVLLSSSVSRLKEALKASIALNEVVKRKIENSDRVREALEDL
ncbi:hypothetical protein HDU76_000862 [Blyttiomyces sp. JEL0837]|nr:hypothetical protein HDU76_000862 [Blyttiomyces sp. JEL0837]